MIYFSSSENYYRSNTVCKAEKLYWNWYEKFSYDKVKVGREV